MNLPKLTNNQLCELDSLFELSHGLKFTLASGKYFRNKAAVEAILLAISTLLTFELAFISS